MVRITLSPLESAIAERLAKARNIDVDDLIANLLMREAAIEYVNWRKPSDEELKALQAGSKKAS